MAARGSLPARDETVRMTASRGASRSGGGRDSLSRDSLSRDGLGRDASRRDETDRDARDSLPGRESPGRDSTSPGTQGRGSRSLTGQDAARVSGRDGRAADRGWDEFGSGSREDRGRNSGPHRRVAGTRDYEDEDKDFDGPDFEASDFDSGGHRLDDQEERITRTRGRSGKDRSPGATRDEAPTGQQDKERRGNTGPNARPDSRKGPSGSGKREEPLPDVKPRAGRSKRDDDGEWPSTEWDELSDVDYWAELASEKPLTTTLQAVAPAERPERDRPERDRPDARDTDAGSKRAERRETSDRRDASDRRGSSDRRDSRDAADRRSGTERAGTERRPGIERREDADQRDSADRRESGAERRAKPLAPAARSSRPAQDRAFSAAASGTAEAGYGSRGDTYGPAEQRRPAASGSDALRTAPAARAAAGAARPLDDDPLTSPSFPRITDDGRSYRRGRGEAVSGARSPSGQFGNGDEDYGALPPALPLASTDSQATAAYARPARGTAEYAAAPAEPYQPQNTPAESRHLGGASASYPPPSVPDGGYLPPGGLSYHREPASGGYQVSQPAPDYRQELSAPAAYGTHERPAYNYPTGQEDSRYPAAPVTSGYAAASLPSYPGGPADQPGYTDYSAAAGQGSPAPAPASGYSYAQEPAVNYQQYQVPGPADASMPYSSHDVLPGYSPTQYTAQYEPTGYPAPGYEPEDGYPADPYAVDPYGYPGYGTGQLSGHFPADQPRLPDQERDAPNWQAQSWDDQLPQGSRLPDDPA